MKILLNIIYFLSLISIFNSNEGPLQYPEPALGWEDGDCQSTQIQSPIDIPSIKDPSIFIDNGAVTFKINILDDIVDCRKEENKFLFIKNTYFRINLNKVVVLNEGKIKFNGYVLYFDKMATCEFEKIINGLFMH